MSFIIAFCGVKGSGKDTAANLFKEVFGGETETIVFAGHLKTVCSKVFNIDMKYFTDVNLKEKELDEYVFLTDENITEIFKAFDVKSWSYDGHVRPHIGQVFDTPRRLLQYIGTDLLHPIDKLIHIKKALSLKDHNKTSIITDLRFTQEFEELKKFPALLTVHVNRNVSQYTAANSQHLSEVDLKNFAPLCDVQLDNNGSIEDLRSEIGYMLMKQRII